MHNLHHYPIKCRNWNFCRGCNILSFCLYLVKKNKLTLFIIGRISCFSIYIVFDFLLQNLNNPWLTSMINSNRPFRFLFKWNIIRDFTRSCCWAIHPSIFNNKKKSELSSKYIVFIFLVGGQKWLRTSYFWHT